MLYPVASLFLAAFLAAFLVRCEAVETSLGSSSGDGDTALASDRHRLARSVIDQLQLCAPKWRSVTPNHTMCSVDVGEEIPLDQASKDALLQQHNDLRGQVVPRASNMAKLVWDEELAEVAGKWARLCVVGHDLPDNRRVASLPGIYIGQNAAYGYLAFAEGVQAWFDEYKDFVYGVGSTGGVVTHYTQLVAARTQRMGCGQALCSGHRFERYYVCNYAHGQIEQDITKPYEISNSSCSACPNNCDSTGKLCELGGKVCLNRGKMNVITGSCVCSNNFRGDLCEQHTCPAADPWYCRTRYPASNCASSTFRNDICPYLCGVCPHT